MEYIIFSLYDHNATNEINCQILAINGRSHIKAKISFTEA